MHGGPLVNQPCDTSNAKDRDVKSRLLSWKVRVRQLIAAMLDRYCAWTVGAILAVSAVVIVWRLFGMSNELVQQTVLRNASAYSAAIEEFRTLYTSEVVMRVKPLGVQVSHDYTDHPNAIPLPVTLSKLLGDRLERGDTKAGTRLYSRHPFPWTHRSGPQDDFEWEALLALEKNPDQPFHRIETSKGESYLRYAVADVMRESCVDCHNSHPDSPKTDWKEGDVRGVLSTRISLNEVISHTHSEVREMLWVLGLAGTSVVLAFILLIYHLRGRAIRLTHANNELERNSVQLEDTKRLLEDAHGQLRSKANALEQSRRAAGDLMQAMNHTRDAANTTERELDCRVLLAEDNPDDQRLNTILN
jgi:Protein of unknown function (DUF3365)